MIARIREIEHPIGPGFGAAVLGDHQMAGFEFENALEGGARRDRRPEGKNLVERDRIEFGLDARHLQKRLDLGGEIERALVLGIKERPDPHPVAGEHQPALAVVPDREGIVAVEARQAGFAIGRVELQQDFRIAAGAKDDAARLQFVAQFNIVEDLAVEDDGEAVFGIRHRLLAVGKPDDRQAHMRKAQAGSGENALSVRPAMGDRLCHGRQQRLRISGAICLTDEARKSAHLFPS